MKDVLQKRHEGQNEHIKHGYGDADGSSEPWKLVGTLSWTAIRTVWASM